MVTQRVDSVGLGIKTSGDLFECVKAEKVVT